MWLLDPHYNQSAPLLGLQDKNTHRNGANFHVLSSLIWSRKPPPRQPIREKRRHQDGNMWLLDPPFDPHYNQSTLCWGSETKTLIGMVLISMFFRVSFGLESLPLDNQSEKSEGIRMETCGSLVHTTTNPHFFPDEHYNMLNHTSLIEKTAPLLVLQNKSTHSNGANSHVLSCNGF